jgi:hypothetical protein
MLPLVAVVVVPIERNVGETQPRHGCCGISQGSQRKAQQWTTARVFGVRMKVERSYAHDV